MSKLGVVEDTLFVPMLGRIYASERYPQVLYDQKALELKKKLPSDLLEYGSQNQYTLLASATRSANMAVSYTHLDVYKRQKHPSTPAFRRLYRRIFLSGAGIP